MLPGSVENRWSAASPVTGNYPNWEHVHSNQAVPGKLTLKTGLNARTAALNTLPRGEGSRTSFPQSTSRTKQRAYPLRRA
jgi:hypothetical protein